MAVVMRHNVSNHTSTLRATRIPLTCRPGERPKTVKALSTKLRTYLVLAVAGITVTTIGCATDNEPTYADLVAIYNAELSALDRLEKKKQELIANHEAQLRPSSDDAMQVLSDVLTTAASELTREVNPDAGLDPNAALDQAVENAQNTQDVFSQLLDSVAEPPAEESEEDAARRTEMTAEYEKQLAALDEEIETQKQRVERARQARDDAESNY